MHYSVDQVYHHFKLLKKTPLQEVGGTAYLFEHEKTKTPLLYIVNDDNNKVFHIAFRTPSMNSTGVAHITEHSVLDGSRKYPVKEPFVELVKGSVNTFLNAMTYPDKTVYPIASTNDKDFMNLMDVYLDAVFYPSIYDHEEIFKQEGWHYDIKSPEDAITYNGVVYNEMKGVYSSPEEVLHNDLMQQLYPDTIYGKESGGYPDEIPTLTYQAFLDFHRKFYHPSNAFIYLYGDGDVDAHLQYIDENYLSHFDYLDVDSHIDLQKPLDAIKQADGAYPLSGQKDLSGKDYMTFGWVLDDLGDDWLAFDILSNVLLGENTYPLKKALLDLGISEDISYSYTTSMQQPYFAITLKNTDASKRDLVWQTIQTTLENMVKDGLDAKSLEAGINAAAFTLKEKDFGTYPKGLMFGLELMDSWLYGRDPLEHLEYNKALARIRDMAKNGGFEALIKRLLLDNTHAAQVTLKPDPDLAAKSEKALADKLAAYKDSLSDTEIDELVEQTKALDAFQSRVDTPEQLETIPKLALSDLDKKAQQYDLQKGLLDDHLVLWHPAQTDGIVYVKYYFDTHGVPQEDLNVLGLLNKLLFNVRTDKHDVDALNRDIQIYTGGISTSMEVFDDIRTPGDYTPKLSISGKALSENLPQLLDLIDEGITSAHFDEQKIIGDVVREQRTNFENRFLTAGNAIAVQRLQSYYSQAAAYHQQFGGVDFARYLNHLDVDTKDAFDALCDKLTAVYHEVFNRNRMVISITCEPAMQNNVYHAVRRAIRHLPDTDLPQYNYKFDLSVKNEAFMTASKVNYDAKGYNIKKCSYDYCGTLFVLKSILDMDYLWNRIRVKGGAYGAGFSVSRTGDIAFSSYRDPHVARSLDVYDAAPDIIRGLDISQRELEKYIIGAISTKDHPVSMALTSYMADSMTFSHVTPAMRQCERDQILSVDVDDLRACGDAVEAALKQNVLCVVGNEDQIKQHEARFNELTYPNN